MLLTFDLYDLQKMMVDAGKQAVAEYIKQKEPAEDFLSQREAYRKFGEARVKRWVKEKLIFPVRSGKSIRSKILYSRTELIAVNKAEKLEKRIQQEQLNKHS